MNEVTARITAYLAGGGLFNPELAKHDTVRDLLIDCRAALAAEPAQERIDALELEVRQLTEQIAGLRHAPTPQADSQPAQVLDERVAFEVWARDTFYSGMADVADSRKGSSYSDMAHHMAWYAYQAGRAARAPADSVLEDADPLQGAANWLAQAHGQFCVAVLQGCLMIGYNRAKRLHDASIAARKQGANHD